MKKIGLVSDPHATKAPLAEALTLFKLHKVDEVWCTGDIVGYGEEVEETVRLLKDNDCRVIYGNHEIWFLDKSSHSVNPQIFEYISRLPAIITENIEGLLLYMVHASPPDSISEGIRLLDKQGRVLEHEKTKWLEQVSMINADVLIVGHTHQVFAETIGDTLVINPGSTQFNHSCAILTLPTLSIEWFNLSGQAISKTWNWGAEVI